LVRCLYGPNQPTHPLLDNPIIKPDVISGQRTSHVDLGIVMQAKAPAHRIADPDATKSRSVPRTPTVTRQSGKARIPSFQNVTERLLSSPHRSQFAL
ncbi:MAG: hypothetical protein PHI71_13525, partial [Acidiphilium sp.]|nr:hypothetical protein [Acidiphilium sp.]